MFDVNGDRSYVSSYCLYAIRCDAMWYDWMTVRVRQTRHGRSILLRPRRFIRTRDVPRSRRRFGAHPTVLGQPGKFYVQFCVFITIPFFSFLSFRNLFAPFLLWASACDCVVSQFLWFMAMFAGRDLNIRLNRSEHVHFYRFSSCGSVFALACYSWSPPPRYVSSAHGSYQISSSNSSRLEMLHDSSGSQIEIVVSFFLPLILYKWQIIKMKKNMKLIWKY